MRVSLLATLPVLAALALVPARSDAQVSATIQLGAPQRSWGHEVVVTNYTPTAYGNWQSNYRHWTPTTLYYANGHYYPNRVRGARAVVVYRSGTHRFLPPQDQQWNGTDHRYNLRNRATDEDYSHAQPAPAGPPRSRP